MPVWMQCSTSDLSFVRLLPLHFFTSLCPPYLITHFTVWPVVFFSPPPPLLLHLLSHSIPFLTLFPPSLPFLLYLSSCEYLCLTTSITQCLCCSLALSLSQAPRPGRSPTVPRTLSLGSSCWCRVPTTPMRSVSLLVPQTHTLTHTYEIGFILSSPSPHSHTHTHARLTGLFTLCFTHTPSTSHW